jgi:hypothetical protein
MITRRSLLAAAAFSVFAAPLAAQESVLKIEPGTGSHNQEFVLSVTDIDRILPVFTDVLKWEVKHRGAASPTIARLWGLKPNAKIDEVLVGNPASKYGFVRIVQIKEMPQQVIRPLARWWDTGGMFNINVLVRDLDAVNVGLTANGFQPMGLPSTYSRPNNVVGASLMMSGPAGLVLSFQQRVSPPLQGWPAFEGAGHIEVGYQIVKDPEKWFAFWNGVLGLDGRPPRDRIAEPGKKMGENDYGMPHDMEGMDDGKIGGVFPQKGGEQLIGVRSFSKAEAYDFSDRAKPPNLGIMAMRLPFADIEPVLARIRASGIKLEVEPQVTDMPPYGRVKAFAVRSPESGFWVDVFQQGVEPLNKAEMEKLLNQGAKGTWKGLGQTGGAMKYNRDGSAMVSWSSGETNGKWRLDGNAICTSWEKLREGREQCAIYYKVGEKTYQSFQVSGAPDGFNTFE